MSLFKIQLTEVLLRFKKLFFHLFFLPKREKIIFKDEFSLNLSLEEPFKTS